MIHFVKVENFKSINNPVELSLAVDKRFARDKRNMVSKSGTMLTLAQAVVGPNASGKTNLLDAIGSTKWLLVDAIEDRYSLDRIFSGFAGNKQNKPIKISIAFEINGAVYEYSVSIIGKLISSEYLKVTEKANVRSTTKTLFERERLDDGYNINVRDNFFSTDFKQMADRDLKSLSLLSIASFYGDSEAREIVQYWKKVETNIDPTPHFAPPGYDMHMALMRMGKSKDILKPFDRFDKDILGFSKSSGKFRHSHKADHFELDWDQESSGTQRYVVIIEKLSKALKNGGVAVIDELDAFLHPVMLSSLVDQFFDKKKNRHGAQLLFSTHSLEIMRELAPYQIVLVTKKDSVTQAIRLDQHPLVKVRSDENYYLRYLSGAYGALPEL